MQTDVHKFIGDLSGGVLEQKLGAILSEVAGAVIDHNKVGKVNLEFSLKRIGNTYQLEVSHALKYTCPTANGDRSENNKTVTPMFVGTGGAISLFPEGQDSLFPRGEDVKDQQSLEDNNHG